MEQIINAIGKICEESNDDKLFNNKPSFITFIQQQNINGASFIKYDRKSFGSAIW